MAFSQSTLTKAVIGDRVISIGTFDGAAVTSGNYNTGLSICEAAFVLPLAAAVVTNAPAVNKANNQFPIAKGASDAGAILPLVFDSGMRGLVIAIGKGY